MNISRLRDPSTLLCALCGLIQKWDEVAKIDLAWLPKIDQILGEAFTDPEAFVLPNLQTMLYKGEVLAASAMAVDTPDLQLFLDVVTTIQTLDAWHEPLMLGAGPDTPLEQDHDDALYRLTVEGGAYNIDEGTGSIIPPATPGIERQLTAMDRGILARLLHFTAYLPSNAAAGDPDDPKAVTNRRVELRYVSSRASEAEGRDEIGDQPTIAVSPVLEDMADAHVTVRLAPERYGVEVCYDKTRLEILVATAIAKRAHLLFMPEMTVSVDMVDDLASAIRRAVGAHLTRTGDLPELRYVVAGISGGDAGTGGNSIVVMTSEGREVLRQDKLCRWNLKPHHQHNYGLKPGCAAGEPDLAEDIPGGRLVWIADLEHLGRFLTLICADMDYDKPGDWLLRNVAVDWLHAPIMDKSIAWYRDGKGELQPWIVARAYRAASLGVPKVVVTNSLLLTLKLNLTNGLSTSSYPVLTECSIAFMLDSAGSRLTFRQLSVPIPSKPLIVQAVKWRASFRPFPPAVPAA